MDTNVNVRTTTFELKSTQITFKLGSLVIKGSGVCSTTISKLVVLKQPVALLVTAAQKVWVKA
jgi:hypothetical protein